MILVDSSFFIALVDRRDQWHAAAKSLLPHLAGETILISDLIVAESVTIIGRRSGGKAGEQLYHYFMDNCDLVITDEKNACRGNAGVSPVRWDPIGFRCCIRFYHEEEKYRQNLFIRLGFR